MYCFVIMGSSMVFIRGIVIFLLLPFPLFIYPAYDYDVYEAIFWGQYVLQILGLVHRLMGVGM
jgi:hypothetical protein